MIPQGEHNQVVVRNLNLQPYEVTWQAMQQFTDQRTVDTLDELWFLQHHPVFTQGQAGKAEHILNAGTIPVVKSDRGGQVTYHGPGQLIVYFLVDLKRQKIGVRDMVRLLERVIINVLSGYDIKAQARDDAPGVYVEGKKIASLGLRVRRGCCYHGLAFNINMNTEPFLQINPCGYAGMAIAQVSDYVDVAFSAVHQQVLSACLEQLGYQQSHYHDVLPSLETHR